MLSQDGIDGAVGADGSDGTDGLNSLIVTSVVSDCSICTYGGIIFENGLDDNRNGVLDVGEIDYTNTMCYSTYQLRGLGPACGFIFYNKGDASDGWQYLEAASVDASFAGDYTREWGCYGTEITGADGTAIGTGSQNTLDIEADCTTAGTAADMCANLTHGGYSDWFLPSKDELDAIYDNLKVHGVGGFADYYYWSSSEYSALYAWSQYFYDGYQSNSYKDAHRPCPLCPGFLTIYLFNY